MITEKGLDKKRKVSYDELGKSFNEAGIAQ